MSILNSELIINPNGSIYHLSLLPEQLANKVILVGDPNRVSMISNFFTTIEHKVEHREFITHTGIYNNQRLSVVGTGIGTDNIDIVLNELDALVNIDLQKRTIKEKKTSLEIVRIGTCGALHDYLGVDNFILSEYAIGFDNLLYFYKEHNQIVEIELMNDFMNNSKIEIPNFKPYIVKASPKLTQQFEKKCFKGITATAPGFYGPQGRQLRLEPFSNDYHKNLASYQYNDKKITNFEMETSAIYGLSKLLGHEAVTICLIVANRALKLFSKDYQLAMRNLIEKTLNDFTQG